ncbi:GNAT family N-acetyltransferase [Spongiactinospora sp. TRM90649]|uniref:GNAT family N-acetyltransferase n=1 Tax=Spongiactinospora sp. TRM90649 TaxID=3031114 RepID=UPI0023F89A10|nr:GNAT family N-acetyltransferase [Spongiactinospora sp. TRM90649]MDF5756063.1 GNAT family N-acetyltransferase [Spongiactinospora sp. TRM90649]
MNETQVRPVAPGDEERVRAFVAGLSADTAAGRFFAPISPTGPTADALVRVMCAVDGRCDALLAVRPRTGEVVGHAMGFRESPDAPLEIAAVVADAWQGRGHGTRLVEELLARADGVTGLRMDVRADARRVLAVIHARWPDATTRMSGGVIEIAVRFAPVETAEPGAVLVRV